MSKEVLIKDIFVSYASEDLHSGVAEMFKALFELGVTSSWMDIIAIKPGESIPQKIDEGLGNTLYLVPFITENYFNKVWTRTELDTIRMLAKPTIPIWCGVSVEQVRNFSPILSTHKALIFESNPYQIAEGICNVLISDPKTHYFNSRESREEKILFWKACWIYILHIVKGKNIDQEDFWTGKFLVPDKTGATMRGNIEEVIDISIEDMKKLSMHCREAAEKIGNKISDEEIAHIICGDIKRRQDWFPYEPLEQESLLKIGVESYT